MDDATCCDYSKHSASVKFKYTLYTVIMKIEFFHTVFYFCQLQNMIKKNNSFISLALGIFFYCNIHTTLNESDEEGERTPKITLKYSP